MKQIIVNTGPFIHLGQVNEISLLKKFPLIYTPASVISEITIEDRTFLSNARRWKNLRIIEVKEKIIPEIEKVIKEFKLHRGEREVIYLAYNFIPSIVLTDDLNARGACENLGLEVHGTVGIIAYAFHNKWLSFKKARETLLMLQRKSNLFVTSAIIEMAIEELRKSI